MFADPLARRAGRLPGAPAFPLPCLVGLLALAGLAFAPGCALTPEGTKEEQARVARAGKHFETPVEARVLPELPAAPTWQDVLQRAFLASGDLEASYFDWKAAVDRIQIASAYPNSNLQVGYSYMFSSQRMKSFDRQTFQLGFDSSVSLSFPTKVEQKGKVALDEARAAAERFRFAKFDLQRRLLIAWADYALLAQKHRLQDQQRALTRLAADSLRARAQAGAMGDGAGGGGGGGLQRDLLRTQSALIALDDAFASTESELSASRAMLNAMLAREPDAPLQPPPSILPRDLPASDQAILLAAVDRNPELADLAQQVQGRADALELARMQWIPDINPSFAFTGSLSQALGAAIMLPTTIAEIRGSIREAESMQRAAEATLRQAKRDRASSVVATLLALRNSERQARLFETSLLPLAERLRTTAAQTYASGAGTYLDVIEAQRASVDIKLMIAEASAAREKRLAELEALIGTDIETLPPPPPPEAAASTPVAAVPAAAVNALVQEVRHDR